MSSNNQFNSDDEEKVVIDFKNNKRKWQDITSVILKLKILKKKILKKKILKKKILKKNHYQLLQKLKH